MRAQGKVIYSGKLRNAENVLLGEYNINEEDEFNFEMLVSEELSNEYARIHPKLNWVFSVDYDKDSSNPSNTNQNNSNTNKTNTNNANTNKTNPQTEDKINMAITIFIISAIGLVAVMLLDYKENRNIE